MEEIKNITEITRSALAELEAITELKDLEAWRVRYLGKKSLLTGALRNLASLPIEERKAAGAAANEAKTALEAAFSEKEQLSKEKQFASRSEGLDITLPGRPWPIGRIHPLTQVTNEVTSIFATLGFSVLEGPEIEDDYHNFEALNIPEDHPARENMQTFWIDRPNEDGRLDTLLRTHTSPMQVRYMEKNKPPIRIVVPGKVYRYEATDATHIPMFTQVEGLVVDEGISMAHLKGTLMEFCRRFFGANRKVRFRCDYFPFVEPGVEVAVSCTCGGKKECSVCHGSGWLEILGAGMVHPRVLERVGIDSEKYTGFAFGMGLERLPMLRYGIDDIRLFYSNDTRFLRQF
ncbi:MULTISPECIES: phenylalanine--tRNA ligase subunit alpha [Dehalococcoides]|jgi:phenylalanyl-tRNA synthetase alpha chain|uniref:phenylalanine--tRNA ligase subunit alpha n=1 Tax=Dehalococcoides TaxID=61434 RepID=UPI0003C835E1|nr:MULTISPECIES: phenylalanine--tRNA ligase subunit alpha [Dehalococcoides]AHB13073.1 phenylalanyl-tRNA synthetase subunit alpha [Dehalococcoides mccartyi GY50]AII57516.1 phenylalanyl-tRNA synthase subunit alpha [Dehalococcoides mccartyi CG1]APH12007.1 phenylalanine--tRNA ligase subunit alpha [Dehalococcoides mccartyi]QYY58379.1 phenylalanine--tRNA ligase subunit alpha [Dehalococcoides mccartyi]BAQ34260.1 phenylalanyl-tRNA synthetase alpha chain [Dehalococcoides sp. UCH007]